MRDQKIKYSKEFIKGMSIIVDRLFWKLPKKWALRMLDEASDLPGFKWYFVFENDEIKLKLRKVVEKELLERIKNRLNSQKK
jgi:hypothetical protein